MNISDRIDGELLREFVVTGGQACFEELVRRHGAIVWGVCRGVAACRQDAEDAAQATFVTLAERAGSLQERACLAGWLHRTAWNIVRRSKRASVVRREREGAAVRHAGGFDDPATPLQLAEMRVEVHLAVNALPDPYRDAIILHHLEGLTLQDAARCADCPVGTMAARVARGRGMLKDRLERRGVILPAAAAATLIASEGQTCRAEAALLLPAASVRWAAARPPASPPEAAPSPWGFALDVSLARKIGAAAAGPGAGAGAAAALAPSRLVFALGMLIFCGSSAGAVAASPALRTYVTSVAYSMAGIEPKKQGAPDPSAEKPDAKPIQSSGPGGSATVVPEPAGLSALALVSFGLLGRRPTRAGKQRLPNP